MYGTYVHLNSKDTNDEVLRARGIIPTKEKKPDKVVRCWRCTKVNYSADRFCRQCGSILKKKEAVLFDKQKEDVANLRRSFDEKMHVLLKDPLMRKLIEEKLSGLV